MDARALLYRTLPAEAGGPIKTGHLKLLTPEMMKLLGSTKNKITKDENGENVSHL